MRAVGLPDPANPKEASLPRFSPQREPTVPAARVLAAAAAPAAASRALLGSCCSWVRPAPPFSPAGLVMSGPPCSRGADGPIWFSLQPPLRTARWFGPLGRPCLPTSQAAHCDGCRESRAVLSGDGSGEAWAAAPPSAAPAPPLWGGAPQVRLRYREPKGP